MVEYKLLMCEFREYKNESYPDEDLTPNNSWRGDLGTFRSLDELLIELHDYVDSDINRGFKPIKKDEDNYVVEKDTIRYKVVRMYRYVEFNFEDYFK